MSAPAARAVLMLYRCPPLSAWMPKRQCDGNRAKVAAAKKTKANTIKAITEESIAALGLEACMTCKGVQAIAREPGALQPKPATDLRALPPAGLRSLPRVVTPRGRESEKPERPRMSRTFTEAAAAVRLGPREEKGEEMARPRKDSCARGHPLTGENLYVNPGSGMRVCRTCKRDRAHAQYVARQQRAGKTPGPPRSTRAATASQPPKPDAQRTQRRSLSDVLAELRTRREQLVGELAKVDEAIGAIERAEKILGAA